MSYYGSFDLSKFHVITMVSNPCRYKSRFELYRKFKQYMTSCGVDLWTIELAMGATPFNITDPTNPRDIRMQYYDELWVKENALNVLISRLPSDWEYVAWIDADIEFLRKDWLTEAMYQLQRYQIIQMWENAIDYGPDLEVIGPTAESFMSRYVKRGFSYPEGPQGYGEYHPGYAWAARREAIDGMGTLYDKAILGAGDRHMALAWVGKTANSFHPDMHSKYMENILQFEARCRTTIRHDVGFMRGTINHFWHGRKKDRGYYDRWKILIDAQYDPGADIRRNSEGIYCLNDDMTPRFLKLRDGIKNYFKSRNEDTNETKDY